MSDLKYTTDHAFLSPSNYHWVNYNEEKLLSTWGARNAKELGVELHEFASRAIKHGIKLEPSAYPTLALFVNDCIDYGMYSEHGIVVDRYRYGTADALLFKHNVLHIWDLKTGINRGHNTQLQIYAAYFCLENGIDPLSIQYDLRIYQSNKITQALTYPERIMEICQISNHFVGIIENYESNKFSR